MTTSSKQILMYHYEHLGREEYYERLYNSEKGDRFVDGVNYRKEIEGLKREIEKQKELNKELVNELQKNNKDI